MHKPVFNGFTAIRDIKICKLTSETFTESTKFIPGFIQGAYKLLEDFALRLLRETAISFQHCFTLYPRDGSSDYRTIPYVMFTVCNRHGYHDLAMLPTQVMA